MAEPARVRYRTSLEDSARWDGFAFRPGDVVISAPSKSGTTWTQMICALLVFQRPDLPAPLTTLSPWLDLRLRSVQAVHAALAAQRHRRFIKTHTPLDGLPTDERVTYLAVGRDPRDVVLSLRHQSANLDRGVIADLLGEPAPAPTADVTSADPQQVRAYVRRWMEADDRPETNLDTLRGVAWQCGRAWERRHQPNVLLMHYADLSRDLEGQMRRLAAALGIEVADANWPSLVDAAGFDRMRQRASDRVPDERLGLLKDSGRFFRQGGTGQWRSVLSPDDLDRYAERLATLAAPDLVAWLHDGTLG